MPIAKLPDGAMVQAYADSFLIAKGALLLWSPGGYGKVRRAPREVMLLTPPSTLPALAAGHSPLPERQAPRPSLER